MKEEKQTPKVNYSYLDHLECAKCCKVFDARVIQGLCTCGSPLLARYDLDGVRSAVSPREISDREPNLWRYHELLPVESPESVVSLGEGMTPIIKMGKIGAKMGVPKLSMKDEGLLPTGTFKARGAAVGISRAKELGVKGVSMPTNGNAGAAWATYAARADIEALIAMPVDAPVITRAECAVSGAQLVLVDGLISDAGRMLGEVVGLLGYQDVSTLKEPYRLEGKKTMGLEIFEQLQWNVPDVIVYPTGGGVGLIGIYKALMECQAMGWLGSKLPKLVSVQAAGCAPVVRAWEARKSESEFWEDASTVAFGITVPKAIGDFLILRAIYETGGCAVAVQDEDLLAMQKTLACTEGAFVCPEGAACFAAVEKLRETNWIDEGDEVLVINTGTGIKYPETVSVDAPVLGKNERISVS